MANKMILNEVAYHGPGAIQSLLGEVKNHGFSKAFICSDAALYSSGVTKKVTGMLDHAGLPYALFTDIRPNPTIENIQNGVRSFWESEADYIVAVGGGSSIDAAKAIGVIARNPAFFDVRSLEGEAQTQHRSVPLFAVPTTGSAAEVTIHYVVTDGEKRRKFVCSGAFDIPLVAFVDSDLMMSMPPLLTAASGMDALTHAIEGYLTKKAWVMTDMLHLKAIELIVEALPGAMRNEAAAREAMALGHYMAGVGISNAGLGVVHSMAHALGGFYDIPHGIANAVLLPSVMEFNAPHTGGKYQALARAMGVPDTERMNETEYRTAAVAAVRALTKALDIPDSLHGTLIEEDIPLLAAGAMQDVCCPCNPREVTKSDIETLYRALL